jgi:hypothetical protein
MHPNRPHPPRRRPGRRTSGPVPLLLLPLFLLVACSDSPVDDEWGDEVIQGLAVELLDRETGERLARADPLGSEAEWEGSLPDLESGQELVLDVLWFDIEGDVIPAGAGRWIDARPTEGSGADILGLTTPGETVEILAVEAGETFLFFYLMEGDDELVASPPIGVRVFD